MNIIQSVPVDITNMQGVTTDGTNIYITNSTNIYKCNTEGEILDTSEAITLHLGGLCYFDDYLYVASSKCSTNPSAQQYIQKYNLNLEKVTQYDIHDQFSLCVGGIATDGTYFYVAESYWDNITPDLVKKYDINFNYISTPSLGDPATPCPLGIQGLEYISEIGGLQINSHGTYYYRTATDGSWIEKYTAPFELQDVALLDGVLIYNDRDAKKIIFAEINEKRYTGNIYYDNDLKLPSSYPLSLKVNGCTLLYDMQDKGDKIIDHSGNNVHATAYGATNKAGYYGNLKYTDGSNDYIKIPHVVASCPENSITVVVFVKTADWKTSSLNRRIITCTGASGWGMTFNDPLFGDGYDIGGVCRRNGAYGASYITTDQIPAGFHMLALIYDGRYLNFKIVDLGLSGNVNDAGGSYPIQYGANNITPMISAQPNTSSAPAGSYTQNEIGVVMIFNRALSDTDLKSVLSEHGWKYGLEV